MILWKRVNGFRGDSIGEKRLVRQCNAQIKARNEERASETRSHNNEVTVLNNTISRGKAHNESLVNAAAQSRAEISRLTDTIASLRATIEEKDRELQTQGVRILEQGRFIDASRMQLGCMVALILDAIAGRRPESLSPP